MVSPPENKSPSDEFRRRLTAIFAAADAKVQSETAPDANDKKEEKELEKEKKRAEIKNDQTLTDLRGRYGNNIIQFMWVYFVSVMFIVFLDGATPKSFHLPDNVLVALVAGTAVSGIVGAVATNLFKPPPKA